MCVQLRTLSRFWLAGLLFSMLGASFGAGCHRKVAPQVETEPAPIETTPPPAMPVVIEPTPTEPPAGSVWDVVTPDGRLPKDLLEDMAKEGADIKASDMKNWRTWPMDINGDGSKEFFISNVPGWCGSGGCSVWLWQRTPEGLRNLLPTQNNLTLAIELGDAGPEGYHDILFYRRAMQDDTKQSLAQVRLQWDGKAYHELSKTFLGDYLKTPLPASAWRVNK
jgi:hypothetical protein